MSTIAPPIPSNVYLQQGNGDAFLMWDIASGATSYVVNRSTDGVNFSLLASPTTNYYLDSTVTVGTGYYYQVASVNSSATSPFSSNQYIIPTNSAIMSLQQVRILSQWMADRLNSNFVTLPEWNTYINQSYFELYDILVQKYGDEYFMAPAYQFVTTNTQFYDLPTDFYKLKGVDIGLNAGTNAWITVHRFDFISRNRYVYPNLTSSYLGAVNLRYRIIGNQLEFIPTPSAGQTLQIWYVPRMTQLLQDTDMLDGVSGWTEYVAIDAAIKALAKEESDTTMLMMRKQAMLTRIEEASENRDAGLPDTISDTRKYTEMGWGSPTGDGPFGGY